MEQHIEDLPKEIILEIFQFAGYKVIWECTSKISVLWRKLSFDSWIWRNFDFSKRSISFLYNFASYAGDYMDFLFLPKLNYLTDSVLENILTKYKEIAYINLYNCEYCSDQPFNNIIKGTKKRKGNTEIFENLDSLNVNGTLIKNHALQRLLHNVPTQDYKAKNASSSVQRLNLKNIRFGVFRNKIFDEMVHLALFNYTRKFSPKELAFLNSSFPALKKFEYIEGTCENMLLLLEKSPDLLRKVPYFNAAVYPMASIMNQNYTSLFLRKKKWCKFYVYSTHNMKHRGSLYLQIVMESIFLCKDDLESLIYVKLGASLLGTGLKKSYYLEDYATSNLDDSKAFKNSFREPKKKIIQGEIVLDRRGYDAKDFNTVEMMKFFNS